MNFVANFPRLSRCFISPAESSSDDTWESQEGWALVSTLWILSILAMMAAALQALAVTSSHIEHRALEEARSREDINAALVRAVLALDDPRVSSRWRIDGTPQTFLFDGRKMVISIRDQSGLIDLNKAPLPLLASAFQAAGAGDAKGLSARVVDWRSSADDNPDAHNGATDGAYTAAGLDYRPRHAPFQTLDELKLVLGISPDLYERVAPLLTVYSRSADVDANTAPPAVLNVLQSNEASKPNPVPTSGQNPPLQAPDASQSAFASLSQDQTGIIPLSLSAAGRSFAVSIVLYDGPRHVSQTIVVEPTGDSQRPYLVEAWQ